ncbi:MAG: extracellular solute-binding protein [Bacilli bacterium]|nr:extracellular solute-binding protein [Bacilli bacterium]
MKKKGAIILITFLLTLLIVKPAIGKAEATFTGDNLRNSTYTRTLKAWLNEYPIMDEVEIIMMPTDVLENNQEVSSFYHQDYENNVFAPVAEQTVVYPINVPSTGLYRIGLDYYYDTDFTSKPQMALTVDGEIQYNELSRIELEVEWKNLPRVESDRYNRYGDELMPNTVAVSRWYHYYLEDEQSAHKTSYYLFLKSGRNDIAIKALQDNLLLGNLYLGGTEVIPSYENYRQSQSGKEIFNQFYIQTENITLKNDIEIKPAYYDGVSMFPSNHKNAVFNMLDGNSTSRAGTKVTYEFTVPESGYYQLGIKYKQNQLAGLAVARNLYINGKIPFKEVQGYLFPSTSNWVNHIFGGEEPYLFYLEKGQQNLSLEATTSHVNEIIDSLYQVMDEINEIGLNVKSITGSSKDSMIDWNISKYLPTLQEELTDCAEVVRTAYNKINDLNQTSKNASEVSALKTAANQLERLAKHPNKVQSRLQELCDGSGSAYQFIGTSVGSLINQRLDIDFLSFQNEDFDLPNARGNFFARIWYAIKGFFYSFFDPRYSITANQDKDALQIWVAQSSLYINILQNMIDDQFTRETGIEVRLNVLPSSQKLVLNNATGTNPDLVLSIDSWEPYTYALRGMLVDLKDFPGFEEITNNIYNNNFTPVIYEEGVYAIPETQGMQLLFYRKDIFEHLGITAPDTWEDVIKILPILQSYQMNYYHPLGHENAYKGFGLTSPFYYMMGTEIYSVNGFTTVLSQEKNIEAIRYMTNLFNIYNLPQQVGSFFEHFRSGTLPVGLGSIDLYLQLKYACPELAGQWAVLPVPGMLNQETGEVERWSTTYGKCSIMFQSSEKKDTAWEFLSWFHQPEVQTAYIQNIKMYLGERYLIVPANIESLNASPWDEEIKKQIISQARWSRIPAITPGSYIIEREISNIWNKVVIDKMNVRVAVNESTAKINRELARKFEEFNYLKDGKVVKEYVVPNHSNIDLWVKGRKYE